MNNPTAGIGMTSQRTRDRLVSMLTDKGIKLPIVLDAIRQIPRHIFLDEALASRAYENISLPIGFKQTISQPYIIALMVEALLNDQQRLPSVLEIGTGCGYQSAILAMCADRVYTLERIGQLLTKTQQRLRMLEYMNIKTRHSDGYLGWSNYAPFSGIIVSAASRVIPEVLLEQLALGGRLIMPVGGSKRQDLKCITYTQTGYVEEVLEKVVFVPMLKGID